MRDLNDLIDLVDKRRAKADARKLALREAHNTVVNEFKQYYREHPEKLKEELAPTRQNPNSLIEQLNVLIELLKQTNNSLQTVSNIVQSRISTHNPPSSEQTWSQQNANTETETHSRLTHQHNQKEKGNDRWPPYYR